MEGHATQRNMLTLLKKPNGLEENEKKENEKQELDPKQRENRLDIITEIIGKTRRQMGYNQLSANELDLWTNDWEEVLELVPTQYLKKAFTQAMQNHGTGPFAACEIVKAWNEIKSQKQHEAIYQKPIIVEAGKERCFSCHGSGWIRIQHGKGVTSSKKCGCNSSEVIDLSGGIPMTEELKRKLEKSKEEEKKRELLRAKDKFKAIKTFGWFDPEPESSLPANFR